MRLKDEKLCGWRLGGKNNSGPLLWPTICSPERTQSMKKMKTGLTGSVVQPSQQARGPGFNLQHHKKWGEDYSTSGARYSGRQTPEVPAHSDLAKASDDLNDQNDGQHKQKKERKDQKTPVSKKVLDSPLQGIYLNIYKFRLSIKGTCGYLLWTLPGHNLWDPRDLYSMIKETLVYNAQSSHCIWDLKKPSLGQGCTSVVECLPSRGEALGWIPTIAKE